MLRFALPLLLAFAAGPVLAADSPATADRPAKDVERDADRKPAAMLQFAGIKPGDKVLDLMAGSGYFTRVFAGAVGANGTVYSYNPSQFAKFAKEPMPANGSKPDPARPNVIFLTSPINELQVPEKVDVVWTSQNYHDLHDAFMGPADIAKVNKAVFDALKPGGTYIVLDHSAQPGSGLRDTDTLHRIDEATVRKEVEAAGFRFEGSSDALRNPADARTAKVFAPEIRGKTDQFILKFRKPA
jgi:predicted methyltransferase